MPRLSWGQLPAALRERIGDVLGSRVVTTESQPGGFSPGSADRVVTASGTRAFVKAAGLSVNPETPGIHLREARITGLLPLAARAPALVGSVRWRDWVALVLEDVEGRQPALPWAQGDVERVLDALSTVARAPLSSALREVLPTLPDETASLFGGWEALRGRPLAGIDTTLAAWAASRIDELMDMSREAVDDLGGSALVHLDVRADNVLIGADGDVTLVDWPWACTGAAWFDALGLLVNVRLADPAADVETWIRDHHAFSEMTPIAADRALAGLAGFFLDAALTPAPPGLPTLRRFQRDQAEACLQWLRERRERRHA